MLLQVGYVQECCWGAFVSALIESDIMLPTNIRGWMTVSCIWVDLAWGRMQDFLEVQHPVCERALL